MSSSRLAPALFAFRKALISLGLLMLASCSDRQSDEEDEAKALIRRTGCGSCHHIQGISFAQIRVGPPLQHYEKHAYIAGLVPNTEPNLVKWLMDPQSIHPRSAMPNLGLSEADATTIARYLYNEKH